MMKRMSLKAFLAVFLASALLEGLIVAIVLSANSGVVYVALVALFGMSLLFAGCAIHLAMRIARLKL